MGTVIEQANTNLLETLSFQTGVSFLLNVFSNVKTKNCSASPNNMATIFPPNQIKNILRWSGVAGKPDKKLKI